VSAPRSFSCSPCPQGGGNTDDYLCGLDNPAIRAPPFPPNMYRELLKPYHKRAVDWAHNHGIFAELHSCGKVMTLVPDLVEIGLDALNDMSLENMKRIIDAAKRAGSYH